MFNSKPPQALCQHVVSQLVVNHLSLILYLNTHGLLIAIVVVVVVEL